MESPPRPAESRPEPTAYSVLLFTDICDSTKLKREHGAHAFKAAAQLHNNLFEQLAGEEDLTIIDRAGDGYFARTPSVAAAVRFALRFQNGMREMDWPSFPLATRTGIHAGEVADFDCLGRAGVIAPAVDLAARIMSLALGGQILLSRGPFDEARHFVRAHPSAQKGTTPPITWLAHGSYLFSGVDEPIEIFEVGAALLAPLTPPPDAHKAKRNIRPGDEETLGWRPAEGAEIPGRLGWRLEEKIGAGGFGEVWAGIRDKTRERRAFKFCFDAERLRALKREVTLARLLRDSLGERDDIVRIYELRLEEPPYFLESELATEGNILQWAEKHGGLAHIPLETRVDLVALTATALAAAHSVGVLHKDIKPTNLLIFTDTNGRPRPRLVDFGIGSLTDQAVLLQHGITGAGFTRNSIQGSTGTPTYSPPEYLAGRPFTVQGDIFSLGVMLYQLVTADGARPLAEGWQRDVSDPLIREDIAFCVDGDPSRRFSSANELATRLNSLPERAAEVASAIAAEQAAVEREMMEARRVRGQRVLLITTTAALFVAALASGLYVWAMQQKSVADSARQRALVGEAAARTAEERARMLNQEAARSDRLDAEGKIRDGQKQLAFAHLARACDYHPESALAAEKAVAALNDWRYRPTAIVLRNERGGIDIADISSDGTRIVTTGDDSEVRVWKTDSGELLTTLVGHEKSVRSARFNRDGSRVVTASSDHTACVWNAVTGERTATFTGHVEDVTNAVFDEMGNRVLSVANDKSIRIWDATTGKPIKTLVNFYRTDVASVSAEVSLDWSHMVTVSIMKEGNPTVTLWDVVTATPIATFPSESACLDVRFSPDGTRIVTTEIFGDAKVWDAANGKIVTALTGHESSLRGAEFSPDSLRIVTASDDYTARIWDAVRGKELLMLGNVRRERGYPWTASFNPDGTRIVTSNSDEIGVLVRDAHTGKLLTTLTGHSKALCSSRYTPDGTRIVSTALDGTARVSVVLSPAAGPPPKWFPLLLKCFAEGFLNGDGEFVKMQTSEYLQHRDELRSIFKSHSGKPTEYTEVLRRALEE